MTALVLMGFGVLVGVAASRIPPGVPTDPLGPRAFPMGLGIGIALCGLALGVLAVTGPNPVERRLPMSDVEPGDAMETPVAGSLRRLVAGVALTAVYLALFERVGYLLTTPCYVIGVMTLHGGASRRAVGLAPLLVTVVLYAAFRFGLRVPIPDGFLDGRLPW